MARVQLRPFYTERQRAQLYAGRYEHEKWNDHKLRVAHTADILRGMQPESIADLSCGDGAIVALADSGPAVLGDITPGWHLAGPIEETIEQCPEVDVFVCSETLEHVENPDKVLRAIRVKARRMLLSTPENEMDSRNPEHYWGWNHDDLALMLRDAGWVKNELELYVPPVAFPYYTFQIWKCQ